MCGEESLGWRRCLFLFVPYLNCTGCVKGGGARFGFGTNGTVWETETRLTISGYLGRLRWSGPHLRGEMWGTRFGGRLWVVAGLEGSAKVGGGQRRQQIPFGNDKQGS